jgi:hypothetical protein
MLNHFPKHPVGIQDLGNSPILTWGEYAVRSTNNNQYYLLFVDDSKQYATVDFAKENRMHPRE